MTSRELVLRRDVPRRGAPGPWVVVTALLFVLGTVLALAWPAGGLEEARPEIVHRRAGETTTGQRFSITPEKVAFVGVDPAPGYGDAKPGRFLTLEMRVENVSHETATVQDLAQRLSLVLSPSGATFTWLKNGTAKFVIRDGGSERDQLQPAMPERVMIVYRVPVPLTDPTHVTAAFEDSEFRGGFQSSLSEWWPGETLAVYDLEVGS
ncbi:hypothetical protein [Sphaerisporangium aureirubrum]|uniref:DUF4352 domain-containing protein n=1 Tax=Sphaerisporangium aureirubrum TaxID=1544736 RepID=A0ABW1NUZ4_9ACTN